MRHLVAREAARLGARDWTAHLVARFLEGDAGAAYGVTRRDRERLLEAIQETLANVQSGTPFAVHVLLAEALLSVPADAQGDAVECGVWKGASACTLSRVCGMTGRRLKVCDSFEGLPDDGGKLHTGLHTQVYGYYEAGMFAGARAEVEANLRQYGELGACDFIEGYFNESLAQLDGAVVFGFVDVDLESSMQECLRALWPRMVEGAYLYSDDAGDLAVVKVFFDDAWWREQLACDAPGFVGSGCGLPLSPMYSAIGYTRKLTAFRADDWKRVPFLHYPD
ncbi:MAG: hypothetical protein GC168_09955 [Candidatus Hydrogenedens sp.]|nr:hypothetical protein [Candidatus Hydrogenedens sp.]